MSLKVFVRNSIPARYLIHAEAFNYYLFGAPEIKLLSKLCARDRCSIDVGANIGIYTYFLQRHSAMVHAYEPNPDLSARLKSMFPTKVCVHDTALSDHPGTATLRLPVYDGAEMHGLGSVEQAFADADDVKTFEVKMSRLDEENHENVGFIKIDVEQHEKQVLAGAMRLIERDRPNLLIEATPLLYEEPMATFFAPVLALDYHGYFCFDGKIEKFSNYDRSVHNRKENSGIARKFATNFMFLSQSDGFI